MPTIKIIEVVGTSEDGWEEAARNALQGAQRTIHNISGIEVTNWTAHVSGAEITEYRATVKLAFRVDE
jgi:flavin-binding protein dodecin